MRKKELKHLQSKKLEGKIKEYTRAFRRDKYLKGFGEFRVDSAVSSIKDEKDYQIKSDSNLDARFNDFYFSSLALTEIEMEEYGRTNGPPSFAKIEEIIEGDTISELEELGEGNSAYLCQHPRFIKAWYDEKLRAAIRGLRNAKCQLTLPAEYKMNLDSFDVPEKRVNELKESVGSVRRYFMMAAVITIASSVLGWGLFYFIAPKKLEKEKQGMYTGIDQRISDLRCTVTSDLEKGVWDIIRNAMNLYAPETGKNLSPQERLPIVINSLEKEQKDRLIEQIKTDIIPYFQQQVSYNGMPDNEIEMHAQQIANKIIEMIKSGKITLSDFLNSEKKE